MSFTTTISSYSSVKRAPLRTSWTSCRYPEVRYSQALATRPGVFSRPSRDGSSPISFSSSRIRLSMLSSPRGSTAVFKGVVVGLHDHEPAQAARGQGRLQPLPEGAGEILTRGRHAAEGGHRARKIVVVHRVQDQPLHRSIEDSQVHRHPSHRIERARNGHLDLVVVPVLAVALAVDPLVVPWREGGILETVSRAEVIPSRQLQRAHPPK